MKRCGNCAMWREQGGECRAPVPSQATLPAAVSYALIGAKRRMGPDDGTGCPVFDAAPSEERIAR